MTNLKTTTNLSITNITSKRILYACLDWGFGHVMRSLDVISKLKENGNKVIFCGNQQQIDIVKSFIPELETNLFYQVEIKFRGDNRFLREGIRNGRRVIRFHKRIGQQVEEFIQNFNPDLIISDHVYGFYSKKIPSVFVTHQYHLPPGTPWIVKQIHKRWMKNFTAIWLMDDQQINVAGKMTQNAGAAMYIGFRSRFSLVAPEKISVEKGLVLVILSGPEVYAKQFLNHFPEKYKAQTVLITPFLLPNSVQKAFKQVVTGDWNEADNWIQRAECIIGRNGYSTLMDLLVLDKMGILLPTPGQLEQEYLSGFAYPKIKSAKNDAEFAQFLEKLFDSNAS